MSRQESSPSDPLAAPDMVLRDHTLERTIRDRTQAVASTAQCKEMYVWCTRWFLAFMRPRWRTGKLVGQWRYGHLAVDGMKHGLCLMSGCWRKAVVQGVLLSSVTNFAPMEGSFAATELRPLAACQNRFGATVLGSVTESMVSSSGVKWHKTQGWKFCQVDGASVCTLLFIILSNVCTQTGSSQRRACAPPKCASLFPGSLGA